MEFIISGEKSLKTTVCIALGGLSVLCGIYYLFNSQSEQQQEGSKDQSKQKPAGIDNEGNTCFVNSLLQALSSVETLHQNIKQALTSKTIKDQHELFMQELLHVLQSIGLYSICVEINHHSQQESINVSHLLTIISQLNSNLINFEQQDAHQLFSAIVSSFESVINKRKTIDLSSSLQESDQEPQELENSLIGYTKSSIICTRCQTESSISIHPFYDLSLDIELSNIRTIHQALKYFERKEKIQNWTCTKCSIVAHSEKIRSNSKRLRGHNKQKLGEMSEQILGFIGKVMNEDNELSTINSMLEAFVLRYQQTYENMLGDPEVGLIFNEVQPVQSVIIKQTVITKYPKVLVIHLKQLIINPYSGEPVLIKKHIAFEEHLTLPLRTGHKTYKLTSLLSHIGNQSMGHYFTFRRLNKDEDNWYMISDSNSKSCRWNYVQQNVAYMLFFEEDANSQIIKEEQPTRSFHRSQLEMQK